jgi:hypothetical protein
LVEVLGKIDDKRATEALARRAMTDLNPDVREAAARELLGRPPEDYRAVLLEGLRYPWAPVANHAAETLAFAGDKGAVPELERMLDQPDAARPFTVRQGGKETTVVREVVRINHLSNCLLCHPPTSERSGRVLGAEPTPGKRLPSRGYFGGGKGEDPPPLIRADTTYLRQDFSVLLPVPDPGKWPGHQRFDYVVRTRPAPAEEMRPAPDANRGAARDEARQAVLFALREITGKNYQPDGTIRAAGP